MLVKKYKQGVKVWLFYYGGFLPIHLRSNIQRMPEICRNAGVSMEILDVNHNYFRDIRNSIILKDDYGNLKIHGLFQVREYLWMLDDHFYQKHSMVPRMRRLQIN